MKVFVLISPGSWILNIYKNDNGQFGVTELYAKAYLKGLHWIPESDYLPFFQNAEVGDMILLKGTYALIRLKDFLE